MIYEYSIDLCHQQNGEPDNVLKKGNGSNADPWGTQSNSWHIWVKAIDWNRLFTIS